MRRYWINEEQKIGNQVHFDQDVFHHIFDVCRQTKGSKFEVLTKDGKACLVEVISVSKKSAIAEIIEERQIAPLQKPYIHLLISMPRFNVFDAIIEKAVEMGVKSIQPFFSEYSFIRSKDSLSENKVQRWEKIVISATQQSGRGDLMPILPPIHFNEIKNLINPTQGSVGLFAYEGDTALNIKTALSVYKNKSDLKELWIIVGSEGGFSTQEVEELKGLDLPPVTIGSQVLRVETACIALVSVLKYEFDLLK